MEEKNNLEVVKEKYAFSFQEKRVNYEKLALNIKGNLEALLQQNSIEFMEVNYRIKTFDSFCEKILRKEKEELENKSKKKIKKENESPFEKIQDICGIRVICYYVTDLKEIDKIIRENFQIIDSEYKNEKLKENEFGYLSNHYIVKLKDTWAEVPVFNNLNEYVVEIQVRTILMHAWADISHKLNYKQKDVDRGFERKLNRLSALFEIADNLFISLKNERQEKYSEEIKESNVPEEYSIDLMRVIFKDYIKIKTLKKISDENVMALIKLLKRANISPAELIEYFTLIKEEEIKTIEKEFRNKEIRKDPLDEYVYTTITITLMNDYSFEQAIRSYNLSDCTNFMEIRDFYKNKFSNNIKE